MDQYYPQYQAKLFTELNRKITVNEYYNALKIAETLGLKRVCH
jgi:uncharacterized Fe-S radical SAM superfamily protein PflX